MTIQIVCQSTKIIVNLLIFSTFKQMKITLLRNMMRLTHCQIIQVIARMLLKSTKNMKNIPMMMMFYQHILDHLLEHPCQVLHTHMRHFQHIPDTMVPLRSLFQHIPWGKTKQQQNNNQIILMMFCQPTPYQQEQQPLRIPQD